MQIQVKQSYKGQNISSLYRFPFVYSKRPNIGPADYWSLTLDMAYVYLELSRTLRYGGKKFCIRLGWHVYLELRRTLRYGDNAGEKRKFKPVVRLGWLAPARQ